LATTDASDAAILAHFGAAVQPQPRAVLDEATQTLKALLMRRRQVREMLKVEQQRMSQAPAVVRGNLQQPVKYLKQLLAATEAELTQAIRASAVWRE
jgi:transposase